MEARTLSGDDERTLAAALDDVIPPRPDGRLPGAGALGVVSHLRAVADRDPLQADALVRAAAALRAHAPARSTADEAAGAVRADDPAASACASRSPSERQAALAALAQSDPTAFEALLRHTYGGYYAEARVAEALGIEPRPPFPAGHEVASGDFTRLDQVRALGPKYREC